MNSTRFMGSPSAKGQKTAVKKKDRKDQAMYSKGPGWNFPVHY